MQRRRRMNEQHTDRNPDTQETPTKAIDHRSPLDRAVQYARAHPKLSVLGAAGLGLFGGLEVAVAMLVGAGIAAFVHAGIGEVERAQAPAERAQSKVKERARAVVQAVRGKIAPIEPRERAPHAR
jgi:hypothetical protein